MRKRIVVAIYVLVGAMVGFYYLPLLWDVLKLHFALPLLVFLDIIIGALIFWLLGLLLAKPTMRLLAQIERELTRKNPLYLIFGALLTILGLVLAVLISIPLWQTNIPVVNNVLPILLMLLFSYLGFRIGTTRVDEWKKLLTRKVQRNDDNSEMIDRHDANYHHYKILDTNILIDGRIYDLVKTGFLEGTLLVPNFVLYELQYIADSGESIKRVRGRRGLDILNKLRSEKIVPVEM